MRQLLRKYKQVIAYFFWGGGTTVVNFAVYFLCTRLLDTGYVTANILSWIAAVLFAFFVNKILVFHSASWKLSTLLPEFGKFLGARVFSGVFETVMLWLCVDIGHFHDGVTKVVVSILVVILNYLFSNLFIFRNRR